MIKRLLSLLLVVPLIAWASPDVMAQAGTITGTVYDADEDFPLAGTTVQLVEEGMGQVTDTEGNFEFTDVPGGTHTLLVTFIGYQEYEEEINLSAGEEVHIEVGLQQDVFGLEELVVTGVIGEVERGQTPFSIGRVRGDDVIQVPNVSAEQALRGQVAGVNMVQGSGQPGEAANFHIRGLTSISGNNEPLIIVDGTIIEGTMADIDAYNIESIEVIKGAAAASMYGSRAAAGVVQIRTDRGQGLQDQSTRVNFRSEVGVSNLPTEVANIGHHFYYMDDQGNYLNSDGEVVDSRAAAGAPDAEYAVMDQEFPGETFNHTDRFFSNQINHSQNLTISQRYGPTNYSITLSNTSEGGIIPESDGYWRRSARINIDSRLTEALSTSVSGYYAQSNRDLVHGEPLFSLQFFAPDVDLAERDEDGRYIHNPGPDPLEENPLYDVAYQDFQRNNGRLLANASLNWNPVEWFDLEGDVNMDRSDIHHRDFTPTWHQTIDFGFDDGYMRMFNRRQRAINSSVNARFSQQFGDLQVRSMLRALDERTSYEQFEASAERFMVEETPVLDAMDEDNYSIESWEQEIISQSYLGNINFIYDNTYIFDVLLRRDGSSLFGAAERWHTYYRGSMAYVISEEDWFDVNAVSDLRFRASTGTAGGRPGFTARFETWNIGSGGTVTKSTLGNRELKPEHSTEHEFGIEAGLFNRFNFDITHARTTTENQIIPVPLAGYFGFNTQWANAGTLESQTWEASMQAFAVRTSDMQLSFRLNIDRTESVITEYNRPPHRYGVVSQDASFFRRPGETLGTLYGLKWVESLDNLPSNFQGYEEYFDINDDGYVVPVGRGNSWTDGWDIEDGERVSGPGAEGDHKWGETVVAEDGTVLGEWGMPVNYVDDEGEDIHKIGATVPDMNLGFSTSFNYRGFNAYFLLEGVFGRDVYNRTRKWAVRDNMAGEMDQADVPVEQRKPSGYYQHLYATNETSSHFVEDGSYIKLRELNIGYTFTQSQLSPLFGTAVDELSFNLIGRNLLTFTDYSGFDPEVGSGSANIYGYDDFNYPNFRQIAGSVNITF